MLLRWSLRVFPGCQDSYDLSECHRPYGLSYQNIQTMPFTQIIAFKGYLDNGKQRGAPCKGSSMIYAERRHQQRREN